MSPILQDKRVSMGLNGDLYFSNVMSQDAHTDYSCNARFLFTHTIQQKNPFTLKVLTSKSTYTQFKFSWLVLSSSSKGISPSSGDVMTWHVLCDNMFPFSLFFQCVSVSIDGPLCVCNLFAEELYNESSYNATDPYGGEFTFMSGQLLVLSTFHVYSPTWPAR